MFRWFHQSILDLDIARKRLSVIVNYTIKSRQLDPTTVIFVVNVELLDGGEVKHQWYIRFLVPITEAFHVSFYDFLDKFIRKVLSTDSVLSSIGAFELMEFRNKISKIDFQQKQTSLHILKDYISSDRITILEHNDFVFNASSNNEPHLHVFRFKLDNVEFVSDEEVSRELGPNYISLFPNLPSKLIFEMLKSGFLSAVKTTRLIGLP